MPMPPVWTHTLAEAKRQALVAIDFYNRPSGRRSFLDFVIHMHLAWQNLLHADRMKRNEPIHYREPGAAIRYVKLPDGTRKTYDLSRCLTEEFPDSSPVRQNVAFFIGLRNRIEHRYQDALLAATEPESHALVINFEHELVRRFGADQSLAAELRFPVFVQSLTPERFNTQKALRRAVPASTSAYITEFQSKLNRSLVEDAQFTYRVLLLPLKGPKTEADMALKFIRQEDLAEGELGEATGNAGSVFVAEKYRDVTNTDRLLPRFVAEAVQARIPFEFRINAFTQLRKRWLIGPQKYGSKQQLQNTPGYAVWDRAFQQFAYTEALVDRMVAALQTAESFQTEMGYAPVPKPSGDDSL